MANLSAAKLRRQSRRSTSPESVDATDTGSSSSKDSRASSKDAAITHFLLATAPSPRHLSTMSTSRVRLLVTSLGNPPPYHSTRHSAGHVLLRALASHLNFPPPITRSKEHGNGFLSADETRPGFTLWQSPSLMNVSGPPVLKAWKTFTHFVDEDTVHGLVVLHDELEAAPGTLKVKRGPEGSARGHNGIKSVQASLQPSKLGERFVKIGVGIGRPLSRERDDVSGYVLGQLTGAERPKIEGAASQLVELLEREMQRIGKM